MYRSASRNKRRNASDIFYRYILFFSALLIFCLIIAMMILGYHQKGNFIRTNISRSIQYSNNVDFSLMLAVNDFADLSSVFEDPSSSKIVRLNKMRKFLDLNFYAEGVWIYSKNSGVIMSDTKKSLAVDNSFFENIMSGDSSGKTVIRFLKTPDDPRGSVYLYSGKENMIVARFSVNLISVVLRSGFGYVYIVSPQDGIICSNFKMDTKIAEGYNYGRLVNTNEAVPISAGVFFPDSDSYRSIVRIAGWYTVIESENSFSNIYPAGIILVFFMIAGVFIVYTVFMRSKYERYVFSPLNRTIDFSRDILRGAKIEVKKYDITEFDILSGILNEISVRNRDVAEKYAVCQEENSNFFNSSLSAIIEEDAPSCNGHDESEIISDDEVNKFISGLSVIRANQKAAELFGVIDTAELRNYYGIFRKKYVAGLYSHLLRDSFSHDRIVEFEDAAGNWKRAIFHISCCTMNGKNGRIIISASDITDATLMHGKLYESSRRILHLISISGDYIFVSDINGKIEYMSKAAVDFFGCGSVDGGELFIDDVLQSSGSENRLISNGIRAAMVLGKNLTYEDKLYCRKSAGYLPVSVAIEYMKDSDPAVSGCVVIISDITGKKIHEKDSEKIDRINVFSGKIGKLVNDYNNILASLSAKISTAKMMTSGSMPYSDVFSDYELLLRKAKESMSSVYNLIKSDTCGMDLSFYDILSDVSGIVKNKTGIDCEYAEVNDLVGVHVPDCANIRSIISDIAVFAALRSADGKKIIVGLGLVDHLSPDGLPSSNIMANIRFSGFELRGEEKKYFTEIEIFIPDRFMEIRACKKRMSELKKSGGFCSAEVKDGDYRIIIGFPAVREIGEDDKPGTEDGRTGRILIMDDDDILRKTLKKMLEFMGHSVDASADGEKAVEMYRMAMIEKRPYDFAILDIIVDKGTGGEEAARSIKETDPAAKIIAASGYSFGDEEKNRKLFSGFITKPFTLKDLKRIIQKNLSLDES